MQYYVTYQDSTSFYFSDYIDDWDTICVMAEDLEAEGYTDVYVRTQS